MCAVLSTTKSPTTFVVLGSQGHVVAPRLSRRFGSVARRLQVVSALQETDVLQLCSKRDERRETRSYSKARTRRRSQRTG